MKKIIYPTPEEIIEYNILVLNILKVKKADKHGVLDYGKIVELIEGCKNLQGNIYDKAVFLLKCLVQKHPFASGNRRTAIVVVKDFLLINNAKFEIKDDPKYAKVLIGIRENFYTDSEIRRWIKNGEIRQFSR